MQIDTGAAVTVVSSIPHFGIIHPAPLQKCDVSLKTYTGEEISVLGKIVTTVSYKDQSENLSLFVVNGNGPSLLGHDWLQHLKLDGKQINAVHQSSVESTTKLDPLLRKHPEVFRSGLGTFREVTVDFQIKSLNFIRLELFRLF